MTVMRLFRNFDQANTMRVIGGLYRWFFGNLNIDHLKLDLNSTVMTRYGQQEGAASGYNPHKPGRNSHYPKMAFVADARMIANLWLRLGNSHSANNTWAFLDDSLDRLGGKQVAILRVDSGFSDQTFLKDLDWRDMHYLIALKLNQPLHYDLADQTGWWTMDEGIEVAALTARRRVGINSGVNCLRGYGINPEILPWP